MKNKMSLLPPDIFQCHQPFTPNYPVSITEKLKYSNNGLKPFILPHTRTQCNILEMKILFFFVLTLSFFITYPLLYFAVKLVFYFARVIRT